MDKNVFWFDSSIIIRFQFSIIDLFLSLMKENNAKTLLTI